MRSALLVSVLAPAAALAGDAIPWAGTTDAGRRFTGEIRFENGVARATVKLVDAGTETLEVSVPGERRASGFAIHEKPGGSIVGALSGSSSAPTFELALEPSTTSSGFATRVDRGATGAYHRKVTTLARTSYIGLRAVGLLPRISFGPDRQHVPANGEGEYTRGPLDRPSVYMGGTAAGHELDAGLTWDRVYDSEGRATWTDLDGSDLRRPAHRFVILSEEPVRLLDGNGDAIEGDSARALLPKLVPNFAFRPFWRTTNAGEGNVWHNPEPDSPDDLSFYPGEPITLHLQNAGRNEVRLSIRVEDGSELVFTQAFRQDGFGVGNAQTWKRVNSIDQFREVPSSGGPVRVGNEDRTVIPTHTRATGAEWFQVTVDLSDGTEVPMSGSRFVEVQGGDTAARYGAIFVRSAFTARGGERLDIVP